jgi:hypothetical protein
MVNLPRFLRPRPEPTPQLEVDSSDGAESAGPLSLDEDRHGDNAEQNAIEAACDPSIESVLEKKPTNKNLTHDADENDDDVYSEYDDDEEEEDYGDGFVVESADKYLSDSYKQRQRAPVTARRSPSRVSLYTAADTLLQARVHAAVERSGAKVRESRLSSAQRIQSFLRNRNRQHSSVSAGDVTGQTRSKPPERAARRHARSQVRLQGLMNLWRDVIERIIVQQNTTKFMAACRLQAVVRM